MTSITRTTTESVPLTGPYSNPFVQYARRLKLSGSMDVELRARAEATLEEVGTRTARDYERSAQLEEDEVFLLELGDLPTRQRRTGPAPSPTGEAEPTDQQAEASALVSLLGFLHPTG